MIEIILGSVMVVLLAGNIIQGIMLRGAMRREPGIDEDLKFLTGRQIEETKRKINNVGLVGVTEHEVLCLINTINGIQLGIYHDKDPWVPDIPYEDIK